MMMMMGLEQKRSRVDQVSSSRGNIPLQAAKKAKVSLPAKTPAVPFAQPSKANVTIQQAKNYAVAQAQQDHCTGNFRIFDSPFGNFLLPVIPTRTELGG